MKDTKKGVLHLCLIVAAIALMAIIAAVGIGSEHRGSAKNIKLGLDLAGGVSITYETVKSNPSATEMEDTVYKLQKRVENYSTEAVVYQEGSNRINVDIPGVTDANKILEELGKAGALTFVDPEGNVVIDGSDISTATAERRQDPTTGIDQNIVQLELNAAGAKKFAEATTANVGKVIAIVYDGEEINTPVVQQPITNGVASITGQKTFAEAEELASIIRIGALPLELSELRSNTVGAKLGAEAMNTSLLAGFIGFLCVLVFMIIYYRIPGVAASIALVFYVLLMLVALNGLDITLTLPGVAGIILSIGMAVDANVIIFQRIREELATGKTVRSAIKLGFDKALSAIVDGNVTTLIAAAVLYFKGSGTIKGFAQTLAIGIILSMFTALFITKIILNGLYNLGANKAGLYGVQKEVKVKPFMANKAKFFAISGVFIVGCIAALIVNKTTTGDILNYGLDFRGGTSTEVTFSDKVDAKSIQAEIETVVKDATGTTAETSVIEGQNALLIRTTELSLDQRKAMQEKLIETYEVEESNISMESISGTVSGEMKSDAIIAVLIATICMLIYIWIRFKDINFGASAVLALIHDVIVVLLVYAAFRISVGNTFIACMLTIVGYSINATIVIFDRIRENKNTMKSKDNLADVVDLSISQTISRSINTSFTTFIMVFMLCILGVDSIREFAIPLMAGIVCGAYSSICITGTLWYVLKRVGKKEKRVEKKTA